MPIDAEYRAAHERAAVFDLSNRGKITVAGPDARTFLHNMSTNDIKNLKPGTGCEAFFATAQARAVAYALIFCCTRDAQEEFWLNVEPGLAAKLTQHLDRYIISEQIELADRSEDFAQFHVAGPRADTVIRQALPLVELPPKAMEASVVEKGQAWRTDRLGLPGYDLICPKVKAAELGESLLRAGACQATAETYEVLRVEAGTPAYGQDIEEDRLVMEVGRTRQAISYTKGCYLGQEPIVMARDRGHVNRTLLGLKVPGNEPLSSGTKLLREGKEVGQSKSCVASPRLGVIALAYLRRGNQEPGTVVEFETGATRGTAVVASLPFST